MAYDTRNLPACLDSDAVYRTWGSGISDQFNDVGLVQTSDTGQANWTTQVKASVGSGGYEVWRFADAAQATLPIFFKVEFGASGPSGGDRPSLRFTFGTGSNGSGTINGQIGAQLIMATNASQSSGVTLPSYVSAGEGYFHVCSNLDAASATYALRMCAERPRDGTGTISTKGFYTFYSSIAEGIGYQVVPASGSVPSVVTSALFQDSTGHVTAQGTDVSLWEANIMIGGFTYQTMALAYKHTDIGELSAVTADYMGAAHTWMPLGDGGRTPSASTNDALAILWE